MIHVSTIARNADGEEVEMTLVYDLNGVTIVRKKPEAEPETMLYTHEEFEAIYQSIQHARPRYRTM